MHNLNALLVPIVIAERHAEARDRASGKAALAERRLLARAEPKTGRWHVVQRRSLRRISVPVPVQEPARYG